MSGLILILGIIYFWVATRSYQSISISFLCWVTVESLGNQCMRPYFEIRHCSKCSDEVVHLTRLNASPTCTIDICQIHQATTFSCSLVGLTLLYYYIQFIAFYILLIYEDEMYHRMSKLQFLEIEAWYHKLPTCKCKSSIIVVTKETAKTEHQRVSEMENGIKKLDEAKPLANDRKAKIGMKCLTDRHCQMPSTTIHKQSHDSRSIWGR